MFKEQIAHLEKCCLNKKGEYIRILPDSSYPGTVFFLKIFFNCSDHITPAEKHREVQNSLKEASFNANRNNSDKTIQKCKILYRDPVSENWILARQKDGGEVSLLFP